MRDLSDTGGRGHVGIGFREFVVMVAALMAVNAIGIDSMLPALPDIARSLYVTRESDQQFIIASYVLGFGVSQIIYGPLSDRFGRKAVLLPATLIYGIMSVIAGLSASFHLLIAARFAQGIAAAATRVITVSIIRDCYAGRQMARVMSSATMVFLLVPILAPSFGQMIILAAPWRFIFYIIGLYALLVFVWAALRLPETQHPEDRAPISIEAISSALRLTVTNRFSIGYALAQGITFGALMGFINSIQQIFGDYFHAPQLMSMCFAMMAGMMAVGAFLNSRIVERLGTRRVSHTALLILIAIAFVHSLIVIFGRETLVTFVLLQGLMMASFALCSANFSAMAMEPVGHIAGTASSAQGLITTVLGALVGLSIGQSFDGTTRALVLGSFAAGLISLLLVLIVERGRLFHPLHESVPVRQ